MPRNIMQKWQFKFSVFKVKRAYKRVLKHNFKLLKWCLRNIVKVGVPTTLTENDILKKSLDLYDEMIQDMNKYVARHRNYVWNQHDSSQF